jgi:hypothetical protein
MLELVHSLARQGASEREIVASVLDLLERGRAILIGNFRGVPIGDPDEESRPSGGPPSGRGPAHGEGENDHRPAAREEPDGGATPRPGD